MGAASPVGAGAGASPASSLPSSSSSSPRGGVGGMVYSSSVSVPASPMQRVQHLHLPQQLQQQTAQYQQQQGQGHQQRGQQQQQQFYPSAASASSAFVAGSDLESSYSSGSSVSGSVSGGGSSSYSSSPASCSPVQASRSAWAGRTNVILISNLAEQVRTRPLVLMPVPRPYSSCWLVSVCVCDRSPRTCSSSCSG
jgi:hypothetical protein